jgi:hypothetical protein
MSSLTNGAVKLRFVIAAQEFIKTLNVNFAQLAILTLKAQLASV